MSDVEEIRAAVVTLMWRSLREDEIRRSLILALNDGASRERRKDALKIARAINGEAS